MIIVDVVVKVSERGRGTGIQVDPQPDPFGVGLTGLCPQTLSEDQGTIRRCSGRPGPLVGARQRNLCQHFPNEEAIDAIDRAAWFPRPESDRAPPETSRIDAPTVATSHVEALTDALIKIWWEFAPQEPIAHVTRNMFGSCSQRTKACGGRAPLSHVLDYPENI